MGGPVIPKLILYWLQYTRAHAKQAAFSGPAEYAADETFELWSSVPHAQGRGRRQITFLYRFLFRPTPLPPPTTNTVTLHWVALFTMAPLSFFLLPGWEGGHVGRNSCTSAHFLFTPAFRAF